MTYSRILGPAGAVAAAAAAQGIAVLLGVHLSARLGLPAPYLATLGAAWVLCAAAYARFLYRPDTHTSKLKPFASAFVLAVLLAQLCAFGPGR